MVLGMTAWGVLIFLRVVVNFLGTALGVLVDALVAPVAAADAHTHTHTHTHTHEHIFVSSTQSKGALRDVSKGAAYRCDPFRDLAALGSMIPACQGTGHSPPAVQPL